MTTVINVHVRASQKHIASMIACNSRRDDWFLIWLSLIPIVRHIVISRHINALQVVAKDDLLGIDQRDTVVAMNEQEICWLRGDLTADGEYSSCAATIEVEANRI